MSMMYTFSCLFIDHIVNCDYVVNKINTNTLSKQNQLNTKIYKHANN